MKKQLLFLLCLMLFGATKVWADSGLYLFGSEVPSTVDWTCTTKDFLNLDGGLLNGTISYDAETKTMTFDYVQAVVYDDTRILYNKNVPDLKIVFNNWATLISSYCVFRLDKDTEIQGPASDNNLVQFEARGNNSQCIYCPNQTKLTIRDFGKLKMTSKYWRAMETNGTHVTITNSRIYAEGADCAIQNNKGNDYTGDLSLTNCLIRDPWCNYYGSVGEGYYTKPDGINEFFYVHTSKARSVMIIRDEDYIGIRLKGVALTKGWSINSDPNNPSYGIEDYYTYDESTNTLTLKKDIAAKTGYGINKKFRFNDWMGIYAEVPIIIEGDGHYVYGQRGISCSQDATLNNIITAGTEDGINIYNCNQLTLKDDIVIGGVESAIKIQEAISGNYYGAVKFCPSPQKTVMLVPCNDNFRETTSFEREPIDGFGAKLENCIITTPEGAEMEPSGPSLNGERIKTKVVITGYVGYDLWVGETQVTSFNASDILGDGGHFKYDASTNTLTVSNATFENGPDGTGIKNEISDLTFNIVGTNTFNTRKNAIYTTKSINFTGNGSLNVNVINPSYYCINLASNDAITCTINGPQLDFTGGSIIYDSSRNATINVTGTGTCLRLHPRASSLAFKNLKALNLGTGLYISEPIGGYFDSNLHSITVDGTNAYKGDVVISNVQNRKLGFSINGTEMTTLNKDNLPGLLDGGAYIETGESNNPTLVLVNATLDWNDANAALDLNSGTNLTIMVLGNCLINAADHTGLSLSGNTTIDGGGTLRINSKWAAIETWDNTRFALQNNTTLIAHSSDYYGYIDSGMDYINSWFIIEDGGLFAAFGAGEYNPILFNNDRSVYFDSYTDLRYPVGGQLWGNCVYGANGAPVTNDWAIIGWNSQQTDELIYELTNFSERNLGFSINGKEMTTLDMFNVPGLVSGKAFIETSASDAPTLVLNNATLEWNGTGYGLYNHDTGQDGLTIRVIGDCTINVPNGIALGLDVATLTTIEGRGTLNIISGSYPIETYIATMLRIQDNTTVIANNITGNSALWDQDGAHFEIRDGGVFAAYSKYEPIWLDSNGEFIFGEGIALRYPVGAYVGSGNNIYNADGTLVKDDWIVIGPDNQATQDLIDGVGNVNANLNLNDSWFDLQGRKVANPQKGIYIKDGRIILRK